MAFEFNSGLANPDGSPVDPSAQPVAASPTTSGSQIENWYKTYLGHDMGSGSPDQQRIWNQWSTMDPNAVEQGIATSPEAYAYAQSQKAAPAAAAAAPAAPAASSLAQPNFSGGSGPIASAQGPNPALGQLRSLLMQKATQSENVDPNSPEIQAQTDAYGADMTRAGRSFLSTAAENGGPYDNPAARTQSVGEKVGQSTADFRANLVGQMANARRTQIAQALGGLGNTLSTDEATRLRQEDQDLARQQFGANTAQQSFADQYQTIFG